jgi:hypothetical protein
MPEIDDLLAGIDDPADNYAHTPNHNYFFGKEDRAKDFLIKKIWPMGRNKNLYSFFDFVKRENADIIESVVPLSTEDSDVLLEKPTVFDTFLQVDRTLDKKNIYDSYFLPPLQPHLDGWILQQSHYIDTLNDRQKAAVNAYTFHGDKFINGFLRGLLKDDLQELILACIKSNDIPFKYAIYDNYDLLKYKHRLYLPAKNTLMKDGKLDNTVINKIVAWPNNLEWFFQLKNISFLIVGLIADLTKVIYEAPRIRKPLVVFRGVFSEHNERLSFKSNDYWSTSLDPYATVKFVDMDIGKRLQGVVYEITLSPKIPCLFIERLTHFKSTEQEVLLPPGITYNFSKTIKIKMRVEKNPYTKTTFEEYVERAMTTAVKYRVITIAGVAREFDTQVLKLADIVREWINQKERKVRREKRYLEKYGGPHLSRENARLPVFKQVQGPKTRRSRSSRDRNLSRRRRRVQKQGSWDSRDSRDSREDVDFGVEEE